MSPETKIYVGHKFVTGSITLQLQDVGKPDARGISYATIAIYYKEVLTNITSIAPGVVMRFNVKGSILYVNLIQTAYGIYAYEKWAILQLGSENNRTKSKLIVSQSVYDLSLLHPRIKKASEKLFNNEHYPEAIFAAFKEIEILVRAKSQINQIGKTLMMTAFKEDAPLLRIKYSSKNSEKEEQEGFKFIFAGAMLAVKDPKSHSRIVQKDPKKAYEYLVFASLLARKIDEAKVK